MQLSSKRILYVSFGAFCIGFVVLIFSGGTPLERPLGLFLGGLVMFWIFYFPLIILKFIYRKFFPHSTAPPKQEKIKEIQQAPDMQKSADIQTEMDDSFNPFEVKIVSLWEATFNNKNLLIGNIFVWSLLYYSVWFFAPDLALAWYLHILIPCLALCTLWASVSNIQEVLQRVEHFRAHEQILGKKWLDYSKLAGDANRFYAFCNICLDIKSANPATRKNSWLESKQALEIFQTRYLPFRSYCINKLNLRDEHHKKYLTQNDPQRRCSDCGCSYGLELIGKEILRHTKRINYKHENKDGSPDMRYKDNPMSEKVYGEFSSKYRCYECDAETLFKTTYKRDPSIRDGISTAKLVKHGKGAKKELDVKKVTTNDSPSELTQKESNQDSKNDTLFDDI